MKALAQISRIPRNIRILFLAVLLIAIPLKTPTPVTHSAQTPNSPTALPLIASTFLGGAGDQRGTGIAIGTSIYVSGAADLNGGDGLVANYALPFTNGAWRLSGTRPGPRWAATTISPELEFRPKAFTWEDKVSTGPLTRSAGKRAKGSL